MRLVVVSVCVPSSVDAHTAGIAMAKGMQQLMTERKVGNMEWSWKLLDDFDSQTARKDL